MQDAIDVAVVDFKQDLASPVLQAQSLLEKEQMEQERQNKNVLVTDTKNYVFWKFY